MIRLKIIKDHPKYKVGETVVATRNEAHGLLDAGYATYTKDMTTVDMMKTKGAKK